MGLQSMTGFGRAFGEHDGIAIAWELRSVNGKALEARLRLPPGHERLEQPARQLVQKRFSRGNVQASLTLSRPSGEAQARINEALLTELAGLARDMEGRFGLAPASAAELMAVRGVVEQADALDDPAQREAAEAAMLSVLEEALDALHAARREEGEALRPVVDARIDAIENLTAQAEADPARSPEAIREKLAGQVRLLMEAGAPIDEARLAQEAAFLAAKADISEEIDRLRTHVASARKLLLEGGSVGRRLDFLAQEFNRESNTLCSKSNAAAITAIGLELKTVVDQFREQIQNLE